MLPSGWHESKATVLCVRDDFKWQVPASYNTGVPGKAGTQFGISRRMLCVPAFAGMTK